MGLGNARQIHAVGAALDIAVAILGFDLTDDDGFFGQIHRAVLDRQRPDAPQRLRLAGQVQTETAQIHAQGRQIEIGLAVFARKNKLRR